MNESTEKKAAAQDKQSGSLLYDIASIIVTALVAIAIIFTFFARFVSVSGESMEPTLYNNDWLIISSYSSEYKYGDIVICSKPNVFNEPIVKRVIATEGQKVWIDFTNGIVYVDGKPLAEKYTAELTLTQEDFYYSEDNPLVVHKGQLFLMGDNRNNSTDSRSSLIGCVDERYIIGKVHYKVLSYDSVKGKYSFDFSKYDRSENLSGSKSN